jgi:DNA-binding response OmpR family regulator
VSQGGPEATTVLIVDDHGSVRTLLTEYLSAAGFQVLAADNGVTALDVVQRAEPDLVLLDIMMPRMDGFEFLRALRKDRSTPVILLTARLAESDKVVGLELGADDYVTKPFGMRELVSRIRAVLRRVPPTTPPAVVLQAADIVLDKARRTVQVGDRAVHLTATEFDLLALLMATPGRVYRRSELLEYLQGPLTAGVLRTVDVHVRNLRAKIEPDPGRPRYIVTVYGVGYCFGEDTGQPAPSALPG